MYPVTAVLPTPQHAELLRATGHQIRLIDESRKVEKLLRAALYAENEDEAQAMFAKARELRAAGEDLDEPLTGMDLFRQVTRDLFPPRAAWPGTYTPQ